MNGTDACDLTSIVVRNDHLVEAEVDGELVALSIESGHFYGLNAVGLRIWRMMAEPACVGDICTRLVTEYDIESRTCETQVLELLREMFDEGLIALTGGSS